MSPTKPVTIPAEPNLVGIFLKNINTNIATQIGIVELTRAAAPEDKYWAPNANNPCPSTMKNKADNIQLLHICLFLS